MIFEGGDRPAIGYQEALAELVRVWNACVPRGRVNEKGAVGTNREDSVKVVGIDGLRLLLRTHPDARRAVKPSSHIRCSQEFLAMVEAAFLNDGKREVVRHVLVGEALKARQNRAWRMASPTRRS